MILCSFSFMHFLSNGFMFIAPALLFFWRYLLYCRPLKLWNCSWTFQHSYNLRCTLFHTSIRFFLYQKQNMVIRLPRQVVRAFCSIFLLKYLEQMEKICPDLFLCFHVSKETEWSLYKYLFSLCSSLTTLLLKNG